MLQKVLDSLDVGVVFIDAGNRIVFFNREAGKMLNEEPEKRIDTSILLCHPKTSEKKVEQFIDDFRKNPQRKFEPKILNHQGRYLQETFHSVTDDQGNYLGLVEVLQDAEEKVSLVE